MGGRTSLLPAASLDVPLSRAFDRAAPLVKPCLTLVRAPVPLLTMVD